MWILKTKITYLFTVNVPGKFGHLIWKMRNQIVFNNAKAYPSRVAFLAFNMANEYNNANKENYVACMKQEGLIRWHRWVMISTN
ncbi:hypothetical protein DVH24_018753 [Malus domestica]|uniref:Uncharacterized protein n=1 Tax=Malus domestica TaxID=3750 RepID=A0A498HIS5_MALDO|nr:hypothetical protein DVH24_018753 [Malus domestica]